MDIDINGKYSKTRCFIDCDGTITNSLKYYNIVLDEIFMGVLTDQHYETYYKDFGDAYELIPGCPWKKILSYLVDYLGKRRNGTVKDVLTRGEYMSCLARVAFGKTAHGAMSTDGNTIRVDFANFTESEALDILVKQFETEFAHLLTRIDLNDLAIEPVINFCREYKAGGGTLIIHSGSNKFLVDSMLSALGISDLFTDRLCTPMLEQEKPLTDSPWGYKTDLLNTLLEKYPVNGTKDFVLGDTKGDAFGAFELGLPFVLCWRGYPKDPECLSGDGVVMHPDLYCDFRPERVDAGIDCGADVKALLEFAEELSV